MNLNSHRLWIAFLTAGTISYSVVVLWFVGTSPDVGLRALPTNERVGHQSAELGVQLWQTERLVIATPPAHIPKDGDLLVELGGLPVRSFTDFVSASRVLGTANPDSHRLRSDGPEEGTSLVEWTNDRTRSVRAVFIRDTAEGTREEVWLTLEPQPQWDLALSLIWFLLQLGIVAISGIACWSRPFDEPVRMFFTMTALSLAAFVGGNHWWVIAGSTPLLLVFVMCGLALPAVMLHFFLVYPVRKPLAAAHPGPVFTLLYVPPFVTIVLLEMMIVASSFLSQKGYAAENVKMLTYLNLVAYGYCFFASVYFTLSLWASVDSYRFRARSPIEFQQLKWMLWAGELAAVPILYSLWLAVSQPAYFALGGARVPMFLASGAFLLAHAVGILRYKLLLFDQVFAKSGWYYFASGGLVFGSGLIVSYGSLALQQTNVPLFGRTAPMLVVLLSSVIAVILLRDRLQRQMDRQFFREKYPLDRALERMNSAVSGLLEPRAVSEHLLSSCCDVLHITEAVLYLRNQRRGDDQSFVLTASQGGRTDAPMIIPLDEELLTMLREGTSFQRIPSGTSAVQNLLRRLKSELLHGFEVDGEIHGFLALGSKPSSMPYTSEDATILTAMSRVTGVALHCAKVHEDVTRLNESVRLKVDKIAEQGRQICVLQNELASLSTGVPGGRDAVDFSRGAMKGSGTAIQHVFGTVRKVAASDTSVLIRGESGTGKELLARAVHENSLRRDRPLIPVHCGALSPSLLESELFGHVKGAFTGANTDKIGRIALADKGTLFLDEIGDVSLDVQVKLLRVLQERLIEPVGSSQPLAVDVRLIAATHQNLEQMIAQGRFREDLYYRLNVITVTLPPLRERKDDLFELAISFLRTASQKTGRALVFEEATIDLMLRYDWPGNIRQLQNVVERAAVLAEGDRITPAEMPAEVREAIPLGEGDTPTKRDGFNAPPPRSRGGGSRRIYTPLYDQPRLADRPMSGPLTRDARPNMLDSNDERQQLVESLQRCGGNKAEAARLLGLPRSTFFSRLKKHGL